MMRAAQILNIPAFLARLAMTRDVGTDRLKTRRSVTRSSGAGRGVPARDLEGAA